jgi:hypothetical protein
MQAESGLSHSSFLRHSSFDIYLGGVALAAAGFAASDFGVSGLSGLESLGFAFDSSSFDFASPELDFESSVFAFESAGADFELSPFDFDSPSLGSGGGALDLACRAHQSQAAMARGLVPSRQTGS